VVPKISHRGTGSSALASRAGSHSGIPQVPPAQPPLQIHSSLNGSHTQPPPRRQMSTSNGLQTSPGAHSLSLKHPGGFSVVHAGPSAQTPPLQSRVHAHSPPSHEQLDGLQRPLVNTQLLPLGQAWYTQPAGFGSRHSLVAPPSPPVPPPAAPACPMPAAPVPDVPPRGPPLDAADPPELDPPELDPPNPPTKEPPVLDPLKPPMLEPPWFDPPVVAPLPPVPEPPVALPSSRAERPAHALSTATRTTATPRTIRRLSPKSPPSASHESCRSARTVSDPCPCRKGLWLLGTAGGGPEDSSARLFRSRELGGDQRGHDARRSRDESQPGPVRGQ
jgi:hypothetical protein